jgi:hypothetical protein
VSGTITGYRCLIWVAASLFKPPVEPYGLSTFCALVGARGETCFIEYNNEQPFCCARQ